MQVLTSATVSASLSSPLPAASSSVISSPASVEAATAASNAERLFVELLLRPPVRTTRLALAPLQRLARYRVEERLLLVVEHVLAILLLAGWFVTGHFRMRLFLGIATLLSLVVGFNASFLYLKRWLVKLQLNVRIMLI